MITILKSLYAKISVTSFLEPLVQCLTSHNYEKEPQAISWGKTPTPVWNKLYKFDLSFLLAIDILSFVSLFNQSAN